MKEKKYKTIFFKQTHNTQDSKNKQENIMNYNSFIKESLYKLTHGAKSNFNMEYIEQTLTLLGYIITSTKTEQFANNLVPDLEYALRKDEEILSNMELTDAILKRFGCLILPSQLAKNMPSIPDKGIAQTFANLFSNILFVDGVDNFFYSNTFATGYNDSNIDLFIKQKSANYMSIIDNIDYTKAEGNILGDIFNYFLSQYSLYNKSNPGIWLHDGVAELSASLLGKATDIDTIYETTSKTGQILTKIGEDKTIYIHERYTFLYKICLMNMIANDIPIKNVHASNTNVIEKSKWDIKADAVICNPPYGMTLEDLNNPNVLGDERFSSINSFLSRQRADMLFVLDAITHMNDKAKALIIMPPGPLYRAGAEAKVRMNLIDENMVETIIQLSKGIVAGTNISFNLMVLNKNKADDNIFFVDASEIYTKTSNKKYLSTEDVSRILAIVNNRQNSKFSHLASPEEIDENGNNLTVSLYVEDIDNEENNIEDIKHFEQTLNEIVDRAQELRSSINKVIEEIKAIK